MTPKAHITVEYVDHMGDDLRVVNAARVSFDKQKDTLDDKDIRLIRYLAEHDHWTPFSHGIITLRETVPIFVARQRFKHTVGFTYNEVSRRYVSEQPSYFGPSAWRAKPEGSIKQGSRRDAAIDQERWNAALDQVHQMASAIYSDMIDGGIAPEQARMVLPQSTMTSYFVSGSLAAWARAYRLRNEETSQSEIRELALKWADLLSPMFPHSWDALTSKGTDI